MAKHYDNQAGHSVQELKTIGRIAKLGNLWKPGMTDKQVNELYEATMGLSPSNVIIGLMSLGYDVHVGTGISKLGDRNPI